jgi:penicillin amidase
MISIKGLRTRFVLGVGLTITLLVGSLFFILWRSLPSYQGTLSLPGLSGPVKVNWDSAGIPQVEAASLKDAVKVQGYLTARDRFFQMELARRKMAGTLAELFGEKALPSDTKSRQWGYSQAAAKSAAQMPSGERELFEAYAEGVNHYLLSAPLPWEILILNYTPKLWTPQDTFLVVLGMYESLNSQDSTSEEAHSILRGKLNPSTVSFLTPDWGFLDSPTIPDSLPLPTVSPPSAAELTVRKQESRFLQRSQDFEPGSNAWAISGKLTLSGLPLLASDPHLDLRVPNLWYRMGLHYPEAKVYGVTIPGMPGVVIGKNEHVAWAFTNSAIDNVDQWELPLDFNELSLREESIKVKGKPDEKVIFKDSPWGPIIGETSEALIAVQWSALDPENLKGLDLAELNSAADAQQLVLAFGKWSGPPQNAVFATKKGDIGWTIAGRLPKRKGFDGLSRIRKTPRVFWDGYLERDKFPLVVNPPEGFIANGNQRTVAVSQVPLFGSNWPNAARAKRIHERLLTSKKWTARDCAELQTDNTSLTHLWYRDQLLACSISNFPEEKQAELTSLYSLLKQWNGRTETDSTAFPILREFRFEVFNTLVTPIAESISAESKDILLKRLKNDALIKRLLETRPRNLLPAPFDSYCSALQTALLQAASVYSSHNPHPTRWGDLNKSEIVHPLSRALPKVFHNWINMPSLEMAGDNLVPSVMTPKNGASMRLVVDFSDKSQSLFSQPGGQSGHPLSSHYSDLFPVWVSGNTVPFEMTSELRHEEFIPGVSVESKDK